MPHARIDIVNRPTPVYVEYDENGGAHVDQDTLERILDHWIVGSPMERSYQPPDDGEGPYILAFTTDGPAGLIIETIPEPEDNEGRCWPLGALPFDFTATRLTHAQGLASEGNGSVFIPHADGQEQVLFQDEDQAEVGIRVGAWYSNQKPDHRVIQIDTSEKVIIVLNEATVFEGDPEG